MRFEKILNLKKNVSCFLIMKELQHNARSRAKHDSSHKSGPFIKQVSSEKKKHAVQWPAPLERGAVSVCCCCQPRQTHQIN